MSLPVANLKAVNAAAVSAASPSSPADAVAKEGSDGFTSLLAALVGGDSSTAAGQFKALLRGGEVDGEELLKLSALVRRFLQGGILSPPGGVGNGKGKPARADGDSASPGSKSERKEGDPEQGKTAELPPALLSLLALVPSPGARGGKIGVDKALPGNGSRTSAEAALSGRSGKEKTAATPSGGDAAGKTGRGTVAVGSRPGASFALEEASAGENKRGGAADPAAAGLAESRGRTVAGGLPAGSAKMGERVLPSGGENPAKEGPGAGGNTATAHPSAGGNGKWGASPTLASAPESTPQNAGGTHPGEVGGNPQTGNGAPPFPPPAAALRSQAHPGVQKGASGIVAPLPPDSVQGAASAKAKASAGGPGPGVAGGTKPGVVLAGNPARGGNSGRDGSQTGGNPGRREFEIVSAPGDLAESGRGAKKDAGAGIGSHIARGADPTPAASAGSPQLQAPGSAPGRAAGTVNPRPSQSAPPPVIGQVADHMAVHLRRGENRMELNLKPDSLGHLFVEVVSDDKGVQARFVAQTPLARDAISAHLDHLRGALEGQGLRVDQLFVQVGGNPWRQSRQGGSSRRKWEPRERAVDETRPSGESIVRMNRWKTGALSARGAVDLFA